MKKNALIGALLLLLVGCAQMQADERAKEYHDLLDPMLGVAKQEDIIRQFGMPQDRQTVGTLEVWTYHKSFGTRANAFAPATGNVVTAHARAFEVYDRLTLMFDKEGVLETWNVYVQR